MAVTDRMVVVAGPSESTGGALTCDNRAWERGSARPTSTALNSMTISLRLLFERRVF